MTPSVAPVLKYPGSKWSLADWIISYIPPHKTYLEPFFGSGAVFFNKRPVENETINDIDGNIVNLFRVIRDHPDELARLVYFTPWSRLEYEGIQTDAKSPDPFQKTGNDLEDARRFSERLSKWQQRSMVSYAQGCHERQEVLWINPIAAREINGVLDFQF